MKKETAIKTKYGIWGLILGAVIIMIIGFNFGGWSTTRTTQEVAHNAVWDSYADICVVQFLEGSTADKNLKDFSALSDSQRYEFMENGGWAIMPGQEVAGDGVDRACISKIELLVQN